MEKKLPKLVWFAFLMTLAGVAFVLASYAVDTAQVKVTLATCGLVLVVTSIVLRWTYRLKPEWFEKKSKS